MNYEQRYKQAIEKIRKGLQPLSDGAKISGVTKAFLEEVFPELAESKDEKVRKALITFFQRFPYDSIEQAGTNAKEAIAWLEKQGKSYTKKDVDDAYLKGVTNTKNEIEKQYEANYQIRKDIATFIFNYRGDIKDRAKWMDYLGVKVSFVEKQGEKKVTTIDFNAKDWYVSKVDGKIHNINISSEKQGEKKPTEWSEDDERIVAALMEGFRYHQLFNPRFGEVPNAEIISWIKSLKERLS